jgi:pimeloyl-ACP methyl ester carboxylesterase
MKDVTMNVQTGRTEYVEVAGGRIAYEVVGQGPLVVLSPGLADIRTAYRFLAPLIAGAGYRVASVDLRGLGEPSIAWDSYSHADTAGDLIEVIRKLGGPAVIVGHSFSGGATTIAAATNPDLVSAIVEVDPFTRPLKYSLGAFLRDSNYRRGSLLLGEFALTGRVRIWSKYLDMAYPGSKPVDWNTWLAGLQANLREPGRTNAAKQMIGSSATLKQAAAQLPDVRCPALVIMAEHHHA